jgi:hypothetical protein
MMKGLRNIFKKNKEKDISEYKGLSDFFLRAPVDIKKKVISEAAQRANEDQSVIYDKAKLKIKNS